MKAEKYGYDFSENNLDSEELIILEENLLKIIEEENKKNKNISSKRRFNKNKNAFNKTHAFRNNRRRKA